jgi:recombination protein RecT
MTQVATQPRTAKDVFGSPTVIQKFEGMLGNRTKGFITNVLQVVQNNSLLSKADPMTVYMAAATAASMNLSVNPSLGEAYIVPFKGQASFQVGWKGLVQLAQRTGQYHRINVVEVYENQFKGFNALTEELDADMTIEGVGAIVGYAAYFRLTNGFEKLEYWSRAKMTAHAKKFSQSYQRGSGVWADGEDGFTAMAKKTALKSILSKYGIKSIEMQTAVQADQAVVTEDGSFKYVDNTIDIESDNAAEEDARAIQFVSKCATIEDLDHLEESLPEIRSEVAEAIEAKRNELSKPKK